MLACDMNGIHLGTNGPGRAVLARAVPPWNGCAGDTICHGWPCVILRIICTAAGPVLGKRASVRWQVLMIPGSWG